MATVGRRRKSATTHRRRRVSGTAAVGRTRTHRRRRVSGTAAVGRTRTHRRRVSGTTSTSVMKQIVPMAVGMAAGVGVQHFLLRPLESKLAERVPMAAKFMAVGEIVLGGLIAMKAKNPIMKGVGLGIMAGGVQTGVKQLNIYHESPAVSGADDYTTVRVPINGQIRTMLSGIVQDRESTRTSLVAGSDDYMNGSDMGNRDYHPGHPFYNMVHDNERTSRTALLAGIYGLDYAGDTDESINYLEPKGV